MSPAIRLSGVTKRFLTPEGQPFTAIHDVNIVVVQGDTQSALAGALAAKKRGKLLAHVEAGVRSHVVEDPWPEEMIRFNIDSMADYCLAATEANKRNLVDEGKHASVVAVTGNTVVSALARYSDAKAGTAPSDHCVVTLHRRESLGVPLAGMCRALRRILEMRPDAQIVFPVHANPAVQRIVLTDAPSVLGLAAWREMEAKYGLALVQAGLQSVIDAGYIEQQPVEPLAHLLLGALTEGGLLIARADDREKARREVGDGLDRILRGLRRS